MNLHTPLCDLLGIQVPIIQAGMGWDKEGLTTPPALFEAFRLPTDVQNHMTYWQEWLRQPQSVWLRKAIFQVHMWSGIGIGEVIGWV